MPDDLYEQDVLAWSLNQAGLLRRAAAGERANDIDWVHIVEEIEAVGISELHAVQSFLHQLLVRLLKLHGWPHLTACHHWRGEAVGFQADAAQRFTLSMRQRIDMQTLYERALRQIVALRLGGQTARTPPLTCPVTLGHLLSADISVLETAFSGETPG